MQWKQIPGFPGYEVSEDGRVRTLKLRGERELRPRIMPNGYVRFALFQDGSYHYPYAHRLVWELFSAPIPPRMQVNHINGDKRDNRLENLEVVSCSENNLHKFRELGVVARRGSEVPQSVLKEADIPRIRALAAEGLLQREIAALYGVRREAISKVVNGKRWAHID
jgi:hypothetical protein